jgi:hypothetical protein
MMRVVMTDADGFLGWAAPGDCARELFRQGRELPGLSLLTSCGVGWLERPVAVMNPSDR